ncbi:hypothetical protein F6Y04_00810 [Bacillus megaterium]|nr:hypothetical protein [Priestia megaterium]
MFSNEFLTHFQFMSSQKNMAFCTNVSSPLAAARLVEEKAPLRNPDIIRYLDERGLALAEGQRLEVPLAMKQFWLEISPLFRQAVMVTIDYGYTDEQLVAPTRRHGSLRGYFRHQLIC